MCEKCECCHIPDHGACGTFLKGMNGRCVYCDHGEVCHPGKGKIANGPLWPIKNAQHQVDDWEEDDIECPHCEHPVTRSMDCDGQCNEGWIDLYADDPVNYSPREVEMCDVCEGTGIVRWCPECGEDVVIGVTNHEKRLNLWQRIHYNMDYDGFIYHVEAATIVHQALAETEGAVTMCQATLIFWYRLLASILEWLAKLLPEYDTDDFMDDEVPF